MPKIKMIEKKLPTYRVTYWALRPGEDGKRGYYKDVQAKNDDDALVAFNTWFDACDDFPNGTDCEIHRIELKTESARNEDDAVGNVYHNPGASEFIINCGTPEKAKELAAAFFKATTQGETNLVAGDIIDSFPVDKFFAVDAEAMMGKATTEDYIKWCTDWLKEN